ncbi:protein-tyrosine-phosphatase [Amylibacter marinus]|uniref:Protein-tyrosine-phosphatase n=1 Tax=Amylibacter marinus TaxID=1475483 RepID=A0ABQ5VSA3_9RHOB|nr:arsenate reductase ArsC [Amylibacter marinus]GLQ34302.1 protein-tyrosine-phosphatase [Amylibacter marinus]
MNVLILCTGNSARSILLEAIFDHFGAGRITAHSAGSQPTGVVNPAALALLKSKKFHTDRFSSKSWNVYSGPHARKMDLVITVCGNARDEECPFWPGAPLRTHWGVEDPAAVEGPPEEIEKAFKTAYKILKNRAKRFLELDFETMTRAELMRELEEIGTLMPKK